MSCCETNDDGGKNNALNRLQIKSRGYFRQQEILARDKLHPGEIIMSILGSGKVEGVPTSVINLIVCSVT